MINGRIDVLKVPKEKFYKGEKGTYLDFSIAKRQAPDQFGNTHSIYLYDKDTKEKTYIGTGKEIEFNQERPPSTGDSLSHDDLPF